MSLDLKAASEKLREFALSLPEAYEDFPWGERVIKVNKKIFVFMGLVEKTESKLRLGVKLLFCGEQALKQSFTEPSGYGLGKHGWVNAQISPDDTVELDLLMFWIEESYRAIAPKKFVARLEQANLKNY